MQISGNERRGFSVAGRALVAFTLTVTLAACGKASDTRPRYVSNVTGADATQPVSNLSTAQAQQICKSYDAYVNAYVDLDALAYLSCIPGALFTTTTREACQASLQNCIAIFPRPIQVSAKAQTVQVCTDTLVQCKASVAQLDGCVNVNLDRALAVINSWSCDMVGNPTYKAMVQPTGGLVNVCTNVDGACNNFAQVGPQ